MKGLGRVGGGGTRHSRVGGGWTWDKDGKKQETGQLYLIFWAAESSQRLA